MFHLPGTENDMLSELNTGS